MASPVCGPSPQQRARLPWARPAVRSAPWICPNPGSVWRVLHQPLVVWSTGEGGRAWLSGMGKRVEVCPKSWQGACAGVCKTILLPALSLSPGLRVRQKDGWLRAPLRGDGGLKRLLPLPWAKITMPRTGWSQRGHPGEMSCGGAAGSKPFGHPQGVEATIA